MVSVEPVNAQEAYVDFWSMAFEIEKANLQKPACSFATSGRYVKRDPDGLLYFFYDIHTKSKVYASSAKNIEYLQAEVAHDTLLAQIPQEICQLPFLAEKELLYNDIDLYFSRPEDFQSVASDGLDIRELSKANEAELTALYTDCSEDDVDTLDLSFDDLCILGLYIDNVLVGVTRYYIVPQTRGITDVAVLLARRVRGQGLSTPLVSRLVEIIIERGDIPRYRVKEDNIPSRSIAKRLGFSIAHRIMVWKWRD